MKKKGTLLMVCIAVFAIFNCGKSYAQQAAKPKKAPAGDTTGMADIESRLDDFKTITQDISDKVSRCGNLDSIKRFVAIVNQISDTILNHIAPIFQGFLTEHPEQYPTLKNISDLTDRMLYCKKLEKEKKYGLDLATEYNNLVKAH